MAHVVLINPNTSTATTERMVAIAAACAGGRLLITGLTARSGVPLITNPEELAASRIAVAALEQDIPASCAGVIVSAFGDPGLEALRRRLAIPVAGIGEASMLEAAAGGRRFAIVTTTPDLVASIDAKVAALGLAGGYGGVVLAGDDPVRLTPDAARLEQALEVAIRSAIGERGAEAVIIGGGPLAVAARALAPRFAIAIVEPIPAAVRWLERRLAAAPG